MSKTVMVMAMVLSTIRFDGRPIKPGTDDEAVVLEMPQDVFDELEAIGAVAEVVEIEGVDDTLDGGSETDNNGTDTGGTDAPLTLDEIVTAIGQLGDEDFTQSGAPEVKALEAVLGVQITAVQRDNAWATYQEHANNGE
mgnify:CR=1 FL=1